eukprot:COSAG01_NODE_3803_length_5680_cov_19.836230_3_plen_40_part_00
MCTIEASASTYCDLIKSLKSIFSRSGLASTVFLRDLAKK